MTTVRYSHIAAARCTSLLFSPVAVPCFFPSLTVCWTLEFLRCLLFAVDCSILADPFLLFTVIFWLLASRCLLLAPHCLVIFSHSPPLAVSCSLQITICMLLVIPQLTNHGSQFASGRVPLISFWSLYAARKLLLDHRFVLLVSPSPHSVAASCPLFAVHCSLLAGHSSLAASKTMSLIDRSSLSDVCCPPPADRFSLLCSCFSLFGCVW